MGYGGAWLDILFRLEQDMAALGRIGRRLAQDRAEVGLRDRIAVVRTSSRVRVKLHATNPRRV